MTSFSRSLALVVFALCACGPTVSGSDEASLEGSVGVDRSAIVGGTVDTGDPAVVGFAFNGETFCTGTLIAPQTVLTAAHCIAAAGSGTYEVLIGTYESSPTQRVRVAEQVRHPNYRPTYFDFGLLRLASAVTTVAPIRPNPVAMTSQDIGRPLRHVGWGTNNASTGGGTGIKRQGTHPIRGIDSTRIESGSSSGQTCNGDSGGPALLVTAGSSEERVVGVVSYGDENCVAEGYDVRVDGAFEWIQNTSARWEVATCATDGRCRADCSPVDQDCACVADGQCSAQCTNLLNDPDCPRDCVADGVCSLGTCPTPDPDCLNTGAVCSDVLRCKSRVCLTDAQHAVPYCSQSCAGTFACPAGMECGGDRNCRFPQLPEVSLGETCSDAVFCRGVCTALAGQVARCSTACVNAADCPSGNTCETGADNRRFCKASTSASAPPTTKGTTVSTVKSGCTAAAGQPLGLLALLLGSLAARRRRS